MPRFTSRMPVKTIALGAIVATVGIAGTAGAASLITSAQIKDGAVMNRDIHRGTISENRLDRGVVAKLNRAGHDGVNGRDGVTLTSKGDKGDAGENGRDGAQGAKGDTGSNGMLGAYQAVAKYNAGDTNAGAIATVACKNPNDTAISGGVKVGDPSKNTPVSSSFAGRMDWSTNQPKDGRLDGWIVQFGGGVAPETADVFAVCVPNLHVDTHVTYSQNG
jgi:hypothetical protein